MSLTRDELLARLSASEDSFVERKPEGGDHRTTIVAFSNSVPDGRVAVLYIGVGDDGRVLGVGNADSLQKKLRRICADEIYPPVRYTTELLTLEDGVVVAVIVPPSANRPHFSGASYIRVGSESVKASQEQFEDLIASRHELVRELLRYRGQPIVVVSSKYNLGKPEAESVRAGTIHRPGYTKYECVLLEANPFFARFELRGSRFSEPLRNLVVSYDEEKQRPMVIVRLDGA